MTPRTPWLFLKRLLLFFWAAWLSLVTATNTADALKAAGVLPGSFPFASGNYELVRQVAAPSGLPPAAVAGLFAGVIVWEGTAAALFWRAGRSFRGAKAGGRHGLPVWTFAVSLGLWAAFQLACEALPSQLAYQVEGAHRGVFTAQLATLLALALLPDD